LARRRGNYGLAGEPGPGHRPGGGDLPGGPAAGRWRDHRQVSNGVLRGLRTGAPRQDLPGRCGPMSPALPAKPGHPAGSLLNSAGQDYAQQAAPEPGAWGICPDTSAVKDRRLLRYDRRPMPVWWEADGAPGFCACRCTMPGPRIGMSRARRAPCRGHKQVGRRQADRQGAVVTSGLA